MRIVSEILADIGNILLLINCIHLGKNIFNKKFALLKERAQWLILEAYPIDFGGLKPFFSISEWTQLIQFNQYKQKLIA